MTLTNETLLPLLERLRSRVQLTRAEADAVLRLPHTRQLVQAGTHLVREGDTAINCCLMLSGFTYRHKIVGDGARQILALHFRGDMIDLQNTFLERSDHNVQALTAAEVALIPQAAIRTIVDAHPAVRTALWYETLVDGSIFREWIANIGQRDSRQRIAHLLCEVAVRTKVANLGSPESFELPLSQEQIADAVGLTPVHVNRTLMALCKEGIVVRNKRCVSLPDWKRIAHLADFDPAYLHLPPGTSFGSGETLVVNGP